MEKGFQTACIFNSGMSWHVNSSLKDDWLVVGTETVVIGVSPFMEGGENPREPYTEMTQNQRNVV